MVSSILPSSPLREQVSPPSHKLAAIYARVSTADQADRGFSLVTQIEACRSWALEYNYSVPESHIFSEDYTGMSLNRPELTKIRELAQQHLIHAVIVYDQD